MSEYLKMQKAWYAKYFDEGKTAQDVVGNYEAHESYPYEKFLLWSFDPSDKRALDFGCGEGRMIRRLAPLFKRVDGVDISGDMIAAADCVGSCLYLIDGQHLDGVPDDEYDLVYSTIAFQHVAAHSVRMGLLREFFRVLRPGGRLALQTVITVAPEEEWTQPPFNHVGWRHSGEGITTSNGLADAMLTPNTLHEAQEDIESMGFVEFDHRVAPPPHGHIGSWIYLYAQKP